MRFTDEAHLAAHLLGQLATEILNTCLTGLVLGHDFLAEIAHIPAAKTIVTVTVYTVTPKKWLRCFHSGSTDCGLLG